MKWSILSGTSRAITADRTGGSVPSWDTRPTAAHRRARCVGARSHLEHHNVKIHAGALAALLFALTATVVAVAGVAAATLADTSPSVPDPLASSDLRAVPHLAPEPGGAEPSEPPVMTGIASNYAGTAGWMGEATIALPGDLGGRYTGDVSGIVTVCADRCAVLPVVD